jgi:uncharacterized protein YuzE
MKPEVKYDASVNAAYIRFATSKIVESEEIAPHVVFDFDSEGRIVGIELLNAREQLTADVLSDAA